MSPGETEIESDYKHKLQQHQTIGLNSNIPCKVQVLMLYLSVAVRFDSVIGDDLDYTHDICGSSHASGMHGACM